jgi:hypothetical protein
MKSLGYDKIYCSIIDYTSILYQKLETLWYTLSPCKDWTSYDQHSLSDSLWLRKLSVKMLYQNIVVHQVWWNIVLLSHGIWSVTKTCTKQIYKISHFYVYKLPFPLIKFGIDFNKSWNCYLWFYPMVALHVIKVAVCIIWGLPLLIKMSKNGKL